MDLATVLGSASALGVDLETGNGLLIARPGALAAVGVARSFAAVDPARYADGVTFGVGYFDVPRLRPPLREGLYALRTNIAEVRLGRQRGAVTLHGSDGTGAATLPADYRITSLTVPSSARGRVRLLLSREVLLPSPASDDDDDELCIGIEWECDNGGTICIGFVIDPTPIDPPPQ